MVGLSVASWYSHGWILRGFPGFVWWTLRGPPVFVWLDSWKPPGIRIVGLLKDPRYSYSRKLRGPLFFVWLNS